MTMLAWWKIDRTSFILRSINKIMARLSKNSTFKYVALVSSVDSTPNANSSDATLYSLSLAWSCCNIHSFWLIHHNEMHNKTNAQKEFLRPIGRGACSASTRCAVKFATPSEAPVSPWCFDSAPGTSSLSNWPRQILHRQNFAHSPTASTASMEQIEIWSRKSPFGWHSVFTYRLFQMISRQIHIMCVN